MQSMRAAPFAAGQPPAGVPPSHGIHRASSSFLLGQQLGLCCSRTTLTWRVRPGLCQAATRGHSPSTSTSSPDGFQYLQLDLPPPKNATIRSSKFIKSSTAIKDCPPDRLPEFAVIGRSNVGKSSLLNCLTGNSKMAKVSKEPGVPDHDYHRHSCQAATRVPTHCVSATMRSARLLVVSTPTASVRRMRCMCMCMCMPSLFAALPLHARVTPTRS